MFQRTALSVSCTAISVALVIACYVIAVTKKSHSVDYARGYLMLFLFCLSGVLSLLAAITADWRPDRSSAAKTASYISLVWLAIMVAIFLTNTK